MSDHDGPSGPSVTELLVEWRDGSDDALQKLMAQVYPELRHIAQDHFRHERANHTLEPTALVHEAYMRLVGEVKIDWRDRQHFFAVVSTVMRRVLVDHARARQREKRKAVLVSFREVDHALPPADVEILALDHALTRLEQEGYPFETQVVQLRFFGGLTIEETAEHLGVGTATVSRAWTFAKMWLLRALHEEHESQ